MTSEALFYEKVGLALRLNREERRLRLADVGAVVDKPDATVSRWERGIHRIPAYEYELLRREGLLP